MTFLVREDRDGNPSAGRLCPKTLAGRQTNRRNAATHTLFIARPPTSNLRMALPTGSDARTQSKMRRISPQARCIQAQHQSIRFFPAAIPNKSDNIVLWTHYLMIPDSRQLKRTGCFHRAPQRIRISGKSHAMVPSGLVRASRSFRRIV